jgi:hypothetical protein
MTRSSHPGFEASIAQRIRPSAVTVRAASTGGTPAVPPPRCTETGAPRRANTSATNHGARGPNGVRDGSHQPHLHSLAPPEGRAAPRSGAEGAAQAVRPERGACSTNGSASLCGFPRSSLAAQWLTKLRLRPPVFGVCLTPCPLSAETSSSAARGLAERGGRIRGGGGLWPPPPRKLQPPSAQCRLESFSPGERMGGESACRFPAPVGSCRLSPSRLGPRRPAASRPSWRRLWRRS